MRRFYFETISNTHKEIYLSKEESHHLIHVMRISTGEEIELIDGSGKCYLASVEAIVKKQALVRIKKLIKEISDASSSLNLHIIQSIPATSKLDLIIEKLTELGVDKITLYGADRSSYPSLNEKQLIRLQSVIISACKQSGRLKFPELSMIKSIDELPNDTYYYADPEAKKCLSSVKNNLGKLTFLVGPEKGWSEREIEEFKKRSWEGIHIHPHILRTETAAIYLGSISAFMKL